MRTQSQPDMAQFLMRSSGAARRESPLGRGTLRRTPGAAAAPSPLATASPLAPQGTVPRGRGASAASPATSSRFSSASTSRRGCTSMEAPLVRANVPSTVSGSRLDIPQLPDAGADSREGASSPAGAADSAQFPAHPAALRIGWLRTIDACANVLEEAGAGMAMSDMDSPACSPTSAGSPPVATMAQEFPRAAHQTPLEHLCCCSARCSWRSRFSHRPGAVWCVAWSYSFRMCSPKAMRHLPSARLHAEKKKIHSLGHNIDL